MKKLKILPENIIRKFGSSAALKELLAQSPIAIVYPCGGSATCGKCRVQFVDGAPQPSYADSVYFSESELQKGYRLACRCTLSSSATIKIPQMSRVGDLAVLATSRSRPLRLKPYVNKHLFRKELADIKNLHSDEEIVLRNFNKSVRINNRALQKLPALLRDTAEHLTATVAGDTIIDMDPGDTSDRLYGCAVDLGTTTVVVGLYDLTSGQTVGIESDLNPQIEFGEDLISRISYIHDQGERLKQLQTIVIECINRAVEKICQRNNISPDYIYEIVVAGNAAQNHILIGINPYSLSIAPYTPVFKNMPDLKAADIGLQTHPASPLWILPNMGGFVGGDVVADMLIAGFFRHRKGTHLLLDIGTNSEVVLQHDGHVCVASSPAGPALEGACISCGMRAESGAIYDISVQDDNIEVKTINDQAARGICGSGLFHIISEALRQGWIESDGRMRKKINLGNHSVKSSGISLTQSDVRQFQLAKAAIAAAWKTLCSDMGADINKIANVYIAGAFGNFIRPKVALQLGLAPAIVLSKIHYIGNASLAGARIALLNKEYLTKSKYMSRNAQFIELAGRTDFQDKYIENMNLSSEVIQK